MRTIKEWSKILYELSTEGISLSANRWIKIKNSGGMVIRLFMARSDSNTHTIGLAIEENGNYSGITVYPVSAIDINNTYEISGADPETALTLINNNKNNTPSNVLKFRKK